MKARWGKPQSYQHKIWSFLSKPCSCILNPYNTIVVKLFDLLLLRVLPWWSITTRDVALSRLLCCDGYWHWILRLEMFLLLRRDGYWHWTLRLGMFLLLHRDGYWHWTLRLGMSLLLRRDGYWYCNPWFFMLFQTMMGITKYHKLWPRIYYHWLLGRDGYYQFLKIVTRASSLSFP
jgi:hypothetical protein